MLLARSTQATPDAQHDVPQGVDPFGQQQPPAGSEQVSPFLQQKLPQVCPPGGHPHGPVEALRHTLLGGQHTDPQTRVFGQQALLMQVSLAPQPQLDPQHVVPAEQQLVPQQTASVGPPVSVSHAVVPPQHVVPTETEKQWPWQHRFRQDQHIGSGRLGVM